MFLKIHGHDVEMVWMERISRDMRVIGTTKDEVHDRTAWLEYHCEIEHANMVQYLPIRQQYLQNVNSEAEHVLLQLLKTVIRDAWPENNVDSTLNIANRFYTHLYTFHYCSSCLYQIVDDDHVISSRITCKTPC